MSVYTERIIQWNLVPLFQTQLNFNDCENIIDSISAISDLDLRIAEIEKLDYIVCEQLLSWNGESLNNCGIHDIICLKIFRTNPHTYNKKIREYIQNWHKNKIIDTLNLLD